MTDWSKDRETKFQVKEITQTNSWKHGATKLPTWPEKWVYVKALEATRWVL